MLTEEGVRSRVNQVNSHFIANYYLLTRKHTVAPLSFISKDLWWSSQKGNIFFDSVNVFVYETIRFSTTA